MNQTVLEPRQQLRFVANHLREPAASHVAGALLTKRAPSLRVQHEMRDGHGRFPEVETVPVEFARGVTTSGDAAWIFQGPLWVDEADVDFAGGLPHLDEWLRQRVGADELTIERREGTSTFVWAAFAK